MIPRWSISQLSIMLNKDRATVRKYIKQAGVKGHKQKNSKHLVYELGPVAQAIVVGQERVADTPRNRNLTAQAELAELELKELQSQLLEVDDVRETVGAMLDAITGVLDKYPEICCDTPGVSEREVELMQILCDNLRKLTADGKADMMEMWQPA